MQAIIIKEGPVKYLKSGAPFGSSIWIDSYLKLYSDLRLEYKIENNDWCKWQLSPYQKALTSHIYVEMFEITGFVNSISFSTSSPQETDQWVTAINFAILENNLKKIHPHPLTPFRTEAANNPCSTCTDGFNYYQEFVCEFCPSFRLCFRCKMVFDNIDATTVQHSQHPHKLFKFPVAKNEHGNTTYFSRGYNGTFNCDKCQKLSTGPVYHCGMCGDYDECEECCAEYKHNRILASAFNPTRVVAAHLSANGSLKITGNTYQLSPDPKLCPRECTIRKHLAWNLEGIETEPVPKAYFEVTFHEFNEQSQVCIGIANQIFTPVKMLGGQQNSFGYFNDGKVSQNETNSYNIMPTFKSGDTVGAGILLDSFHHRRLFFTKNGQMIGMFPDRVHKGMDCFPGVSFTSQSQAWFTANYDGPFMFDTNTVPNYRLDKTTYIDQLPDEIVANCLSFVAQTPSQVLEMRLVSKKFAQQALGNEIWLGLFMTTWPLQNDKLKVKSWYKMYKARKAATKEKFPFNDYHPIENCEFEFQCPLMWEKLIGRTDNPNERFCDKCQKTVYAVKDEATLRDYAAKGRCVSFVPPFAPVPMMGMPVQLNFVPPPFQQPPPIGGPYGLPLNPNPLPPGGFNNYA